MSKKEKLKLVLEAEGILSTLRIAAYYNNIKKDASSHLRRIEYLKSDLIPKINDMLIKELILEM